MVIKTLTIILILLTTAVYAGNSKFQGDGGSGRISGGGSGRTLQSVTLTDSTTTLAWDAVEDATGYKLYQAFNNSSFELIKTTGETQTTIETSAGGYVWYVTAYDANGESGPSKIVIGKR